jgi:Domain of unknown function (DUF4291)
MTADASTPLRQIRASLTESTLVVYQAYPPEIAEPGLAAGRFVAPFKRERMTWIKPSFLWMAYRCGWATKPGQERVLAIEITREGFEWALAHACLSHFEPGTYADHDAWAAALAASPVRIQWDPERNLELAPLDHRSIQIGLAGDAARRYVDEWIVSLTDATQQFRRIQQLVAAGAHDAARTLLPRETPYPLSPELAARIGATP